MALIHRVDGLASVSPQASLAAQMHWLVTCAYGLHLVDDEAIELWMVAELTDYDLLQNIRYHGGFGELLSSHADKPVRARAQVLKERLNNLLVATMETDA